MVETNILPYPLMLANLQLPITPEATLISIWPGAQAVPLPYLKMKPSPVTGNSETEPPSPPTLISLTIPEPSLLSSPRLQPAGSALVMLPPRRSLRLRVDRGLRHQYRIRC